MSPCWLAGECEPTSARRVGTRSLLAFDQCAHGEHIERVSARRMHFADENRSHELVVSRGEKCAIGIERDIRGQSVSLQRAGEHDSIERLLLIGDLSERADPGIAEPVARAGRLAGAAADRGVEPFDPRDLRLIPPPFHGPPADPGFVGHGQNALQLE